MSFLDEISREPDILKKIWIPKIFWASDHIVHGINKANMILNGGVFYTESQRFWQERGLVGDKPLEQLRQLSIMVLEAKEYQLVIHEILSGVRNQGFQQSFMEELDTNLHHQVACLYSNFAAANLTFSNTFSSAVTGDELVRFINDIVTETFKAINSLKAESSLKAVRQADFNEISAAISKNSTARWLHPIVITDWPEAPFCGNN